MAMYPEEVFGLVETERMEDLWRGDMNWVRRNDLGKDDEGSGRVMEV